MSSPRPTTSVVRPPRGQENSGAAPALANPPLWPLAWPLMLREWLHHPWRHGVALLAVALGVALAYSVHLINSSALAEFSQAVRTANGEPDVSLRASQTSLNERPGFDDALFEQVATDPAVALASPVVEIDTHAQAADGSRVAVRVLGIDALRAAALAPSLMPAPALGESSLVFLDPDAAFPNLAARERLGLADAGPVALQAGTAWQRFRVAGTTPAAGPPLVVMDIAAAQARFELAGRLSRIDIRWLPGTDGQAWLKQQSLPANVRAVAADEGAQRVSNLSRAYRVNLTVLALVALFVGAFLVFSVVSLSVAQRTPGFALLGVLGMTAGQRRGLVLLECAALGGAGSALGLALGAAMAFVALRWLSGDLGGGYFPGITPSLQIGPVSALVFWLLGSASAVLGGWWPALQAQRIAPAQALKGLGNQTQAVPPLWPGLALIGLGSAAAFVPPLWGLPLAAYVGVAALLLGGVALVPAAVHALLAGVAPPRGALPLLAVQRARFQRATATAAVAGVVASLALSVALTVMVSSFRSGVSDWLDSVLPADLYARTAASSSLGEQAWLPADFTTRAAAVPGVARVQAARTRALALAPGRPTVSLISRALPDPDSALPMIETARPRSTLAANEVGVYVSEAMVALYGAKVGSSLVLPLAEPAVTARVLGVWRDYARQFGAVVIDEADYQRLTADTRVNDLALWLAPGADSAAVQQGLRALLPDPTMLDFAGSAELRALSLRIFDRSFAVTYYLQAVAIGIGLLGVAASLSAQVLARRKEFGLLAHLGLTRGQVVAVVAGEGAAWVAAGVLVGLLLGLAVSLVLVFVVNPQSFHWTMPLVLPWGRLGLLCTAVAVAGVGTVAFTARRAAGQSAVLSVKEDW